MTLAHAGGAVTDWLTAIGTVGAVVVALVLARRQNAEYLRVTCQVGYVACGTRDGMGGYVGDKLEPFVRISATNDGPSPGDRQHVRVASGLGDEEVLVATDGSGER